MELLTHINDNEWESIDYYLQRGDTDFSGVPDNYTWRSIKDTVKNIEHDFPLIKTFKKDYDFLMNDSGLNFAWDIHQENIMKRNNGEFVLTDPFWEGENPYQRYDSIVRGEIGDYPEHSDYDYINGGEIYKKPKPIKMKPMVTKQPEEDIPF
jgi:hypothetical protein